MNDMTAGVMTPLPELGMSSKTLSVIAIGISLLSMILSAFFSSLALRRAKRGPAPRAAWEFTRSTRRVHTRSGSRDELGPYVLRNTKDGDARKVCLDWVVAPARYDGPDQWKCFSAHSEVLMPMGLSHDGPPPVIRLRWRDAHGRHVWVSEPQP